MALSKRTRFEVFKRDDFQCQYCGRRTPSVVLEVDHIVPIAEGGGDERENLTTSCSECNQGKGPIPLTNKAAIEDLVERKRLIEERSEQLKAYNRVLAKRTRDEDAAVSEIMEYWDEIHEPCGRYYGLFKNVVRCYVRQLPMELIKQAARITCDKHAGESFEPNYFAGVCRAMVAENDDRVQKCPGCGKRVILKPGFDRSKQWWHTPCLEKHKAKLMDKGQKP